MSQPVNDRRPYHWLVIGGTGSGKTYLARQIIRVYAKKPDYIIVVNSSKQLREFARHHEVVDIAALEAGFTTRELYVLIKRHGAVHFEVSPGGDEKDIRRFMDCLGNAAMELGRLETNRCMVLMVLDECQNYVGKKVFSRGMKRVYSEGRKFGVDTVNITQQLAGDGDTIHMTVRRMISVLVVCPMDEEAERDRIQRTWSELRDPGELAFPDPKTHRPGEYMVRDRGSRRACIVRVDARGKRYTEPLFRADQRPAPKRRRGGPAPPKRRAA
ncbi:hypothetical protein ACFFLM_21245 [Deinococcus oregonensis]|uniref:AAA+ ATPase domain-containing protein n=1 Tax=Deinococcus oregonensis TaxID=1805970 RepID=A0ABV6B406_9DEIO